jgi:hypothetical protein
MAMLNRWEFFKKALSRAKEHMEKRAEKSHTFILLAIGILLVVALAIGVAIHFHESAVAIVTAVVAAAAFVYWLGFESYYSIYCEECRKVEKLAGERDQATEKIKPRLEILDEAEIDRTGPRGCCRIRVKSLCDTSLKFGVEIKKISPSVDGIPLPLAIRMTQDVNELMGNLPAGQTRTADVVMGTEFELWFLGIGDSHVPAPRRVYNLVICAHCDQGPSVEKEFFVDSEQAIPRLHVGSTVAAK